MTVLTNRGAAITQVRAEGTCGQLGPLTTPSLVVPTPVIPAGRSRGASPSLWPSFTRLVAYRGAEGSCSCLSATTPLPTPSS